RGKDHGTRAERQHQRENRTEQEVAHAAEHGMATGRLARSFRLLAEGRDGRLGHAALPPTISSPTCCCALSPFSTTPTIRPRESTAIRSHRSSSSSRSVEITTDVTPSSAWSRIVCLTLLVVLTSSPYVGLL